MEHLTEQIKATRGFTQDIYNALYYYSHTLYKTINTKLRNGDILDYSESKYVDDIDSAFYMIPKLTAPIMVYRGSNRRYGSEMIQIKSFVSTSLRKGVGLEFIDHESKCCLYIITIPAGTRILPMMPTSMYKFEEEILLQRNSRFFMTTSVKERGIDIYYITLISPTSVPMSKFNVDTIELTAYEIKAQVSMKLRHLLESQVDDSELLLFDSTGDYINKIIKSLKINMDDITSEDYSRMIVELDDKKMKYSQY
jgi:hypothetical protein